jgi:hypothetical protein
LGYTFGDGTMSISENAVSRGSSENISFRLHKGQLDQLRQEAREKRISLNTLASQIVDSYVNYTSRASRAGAIPVSRLALEVLLEGYTEDQIKAMAERIVKMSGEDTTLMLQGRYDFEALLQSFESWLKATDFPYRHTRTKNMHNSRHSFIVQHDMGRKYSVFAAEGFKTYFEPRITREIEYSITENIISITVEGA